MGLISGIMAVLFGGNRNVVRETAEIFREGADASAARAAGLREQAIHQFGAEFQASNKGRFDRFMDGLNRLPRPALALGTLGLFLAAMADPLWFAARMQGIALVPEPLWWLLGVIVSFYFGARHQVKAQDFQREIGATALRTPTVLDNLNALRSMGQQQSAAADTSPDAELTRQVLKQQENAALEAWRQKRNA